MKMCVFKGWSRGDFYTKSSITASSSLRGACINSKKLADFVAQFVNSSKSQNSVGNSGNRSHIAEYVIFVLEAINLDSH